MNEFHKLLGVSSSIGEKERQRERVENAALMIMCAWISNEDLAFVAEDLVEDSFEQAEAWYAEAMKRREAAKAQRNEHAPSK